MRQAALRQPVARMSCLSHARGYLLSIGRAKNVYEIWLKIVRVFAACIAFCFSSHTFFAGRIVCLSVPALLNRRDIRGSRHISATGNDPQLYGAISRFVAARLKVLFQTSRSMVTANVSEAMNRYFDDYRQTGLNTPVAVAQKPQSSARLLAYLLNRRHKKRRPWTPFLIVWWSRGDLSPRQIPLFRGL